MPERVGTIAQAIEALLHRRGGGTGKHPDFTVGLVGRGIQRSKTPSMHEQEAQRLGFSCTYVLIDFDFLELEDADLELTLLAARRLGFAGLNVTYPFKQSVMALLDEVGPEAQAIGAVNTIVFGERTVGHNTDFWGFAESFRSQMSGVSLDRVTVFGAGGAGSAICAALVSLGASEVQIIDPDTARAADLALRLSLAGGAHIVASQDANAAVRQSAGVVNTTPVGMAKYPGTPFPAEWLRPSQWVADIIYFPQETELLAWARQIGCRTLPGIGMAIGQALRAFELFTGHAADMTAMAGHFEAAA